MIVTGCSTISNDTSNDTNTDTQDTSEDTTQIVETIDQTINSDYTAWEDESPIYISLASTTATTDNADGVSISDGVITISKAGTYVFSGTLTNGQIIVEASSEDNVRIVLNNVDIYCETSSPIYIKQAKNATITLAEGTSNYLSDGTTYTLNTDDEPSATIFSKDDLKFNGTGTLTITANYNNAIQSKDDLFILSGTYNITSVNNGLVGKDSVRIATTTLNIVAENDGIKSTNDTDDTKGYILINGGVFNIVADGDGLSAETQIIINDGDFTIKTGGGSTNSVSSSDDTSHKGIKATTSITINNGNFVIDSSDDSLHSNNDLIINNGTFTITSGDDGMHSDTNLTINNGTININKSYEGIESSNITINGGNTYVVSSDDGINVAGGTDSSSVNGRPGQNSFTTSSNMLLTITNGNIVVVATGDGIDVNGSIVITGGEIYVNGPTANDNGALDYDGTLDISGGSLLAIGSSNMAQTPSSSSSQYSMAITLNSFAEAGSVITVKAGDDIVFQYTSLKSYSSIIISSPDFNTSTDYTIFIDDTELSTITLTGVVTYINSTGTTNSTQGFGDKGSAPNQERK